MHERDGTGNAEAKNSFQVPYRNSTPAAARQAAPEAENPFCLAPPKILKPQTKPMEKPVCPQHPLGTECPNFTDERGEREHATECKSDEEPTDSACDQVPPTPRTTTDESPLLCLTSFFALSWGKNLFEVHGVPHRKTPRLSGNISQTDCSPTLSSNHSIPPED